MSRRAALLLVLVPILVLVPRAALAHSREAAGFISGFVHPFLGVDHLLAMLSVGVISARIGGAYIWRIPALFVSAMVAGGVIGAWGIALPMVEWGIGLSVLVLGGAIVVVQQGSRTILIVVMAFVAFFGTLHGHAHGAEMPASASPPFYSAGFVVSTTLVHLLGVLLGRLPGKAARFRKLPSYVGSAITIGGILILYGLTAE